MPTTTGHNSETARTAQTGTSGASDLRRYIYCIIYCDGPKSFDCDAMDKRCRDVHAVTHDGIGAVVSPTPEERYVIDRQNILAHQRLMEQVMQQGHTVLPVKFDTIAEAKSGMGPEERIIEQVLDRRLEELSSLLGVMSTRVEMGVKALWKDMNAIFREIVDSDAEVRRLRERIACESPHGKALFGARVKLGEMAKAALDAKKEREQEALLNAIRDIVADSRRNKTFGDQMFANLSLLVEKSRMEELDRKLNELADAAPERINLRYVGPLPPSNFVELVITWEE